ncbi:MAG: 5-(carboxyamino)imidazole ribonucleotide mutase [Anaerolineae bacterium]|nr:5-(carboxyamino)imidazole ribonucleotide mutase [Anaerolineae bacterium]
MTHKKPLVGIVMGSASDLEVMRGAAEILDSLGIANEMKVASAHRTPELVHEYVTTAPQRGIEVLIGGAGGAAHLPGVMASLTTLPVIGVPVQSKALQGLDSLLSMVQMPSGIPVATVGIDGAKNAGLLAARILAIKYPELEKRLREYAEVMADNIRAIQLG